MPDSIAPEERAMIDAALAAGKAQRVPMGAYNEALYRYVPPKGKSGGNLEPTQPNGWKDQQKAFMDRGRALRHAGQRAARDARREQVAALRASHSIAQMARALGVSDFTITLDIRALKAAGRLPEGAPNAKP